MFAPGEIEGASLGVEGAFSELERRIMDDIVRRIRINGEITRSADWQLHRLHELGASDAAVRAYIQDCLHYSDRQMTQLYYGVLRKGYYRDGSLYRGTGTDMIPFEENDDLQRLIEAVSQQTSGEMKNITQSLGFAVRQNGRLRFLPIADYYQRTLDGAMFDISSGAFDYNTVLKRVTKELTNSGLRTVDYASGRSIRVESAARMCVMTGFSQLTAKVNEQNADELGTECFEVTWHGGARPEHQEWQGKVYKKDELYSICGLGAPDGLCGCNCYHDYYPFIPGLSERAYTDVELEKLNREENIPKEYHDKTYTAYEATQRQRALERTMRAQRQTIHLLQTGGADEEDIMLARGKYRALSSEYTHFSKAMGIPQQRERVTVDGLGNVGKGKYTKTDEPAKIPSLGSRITDRVTDEERRELLKRGVPSMGEQLVNVLNARKEQVEKGVAFLEKSDIIKIKSELRKKIENGDLPLALNHQKQARHLLSEGETRKADGRSFLIISESQAQTIINEMHLTGSIIYNAKSDQYKEIIQCEKEIGFDAHTESFTNRGVIHYSKTGTHLVPVQRGDET